MPFAISGVYAAIATPFNRDLTPDIGALAAHGRWLLSEGCDGLAPLGTTGEAMSLSVAERQNLLRDLLAAGIPPGKILLGTGAAAVADTIALTEHALDHGVTQTLTLPPFYYKTATVDGLFTAYSSIINTLNDPRLRMVLYHIPHISGVAIPHDLIARLTAEFPDTVIGIKDSSGDWDNLATMVDRFPGFAVMTGADPLVRRLLGIGGAGCITGGANVLPASLAKVYAAHADTTLETELDPEMDAALTQEMARIEALRSLTLSLPQFPALKTMIAEISGSESFCRLRPPLMPVNAGEKQAALEGLRRIL